MVSKKGFAFGVLAAGGALFAMAALVASPGGAREGRVWAGAIPGECGFDWRVVPSPNSSGNNYLNSVAVISSTDAWAVGYHVDSGNLQQMLIMHWDGNQWT